MGWWGGFSGWLRGCRGGWGFPTVQKNVHGQTTKPQAGLTYSANPLWGLLFSGPSKELEEAGSIRKQQQRNMKQQETKQPWNVELALARVSSASTHFYCTRFVLPASASISQFRLALKEWHFVVGAHFKDACRRCRLPLCLSWWAVLVDACGRKSCGRCS